MSDDIPEAWVRPVKRETYISAIGTTSLRVVASAYVGLNNVKIIRLIAKSGTAPKETDVLSEDYGVKVGDGQVKDFMVNYKLEKDEDLDDMNPFDVTCLAKIIELMDDTLPEFIDKKTRESHPPDLPISLMEVEITDPKFIEIADIENPKLDLRFNTLKAENDQLKQDIYDKHRDHALSYLFTHGFKRHTLNCQMVIETFKRFSEKEDPKNALMYWGGKDDLFPKTDYNLWLFIHTHYIIPRAFAIQKKLVLADEDKLSLDGYKWG